MKIKKQTLESLTKNLLKQTPFNFLSDEDKERILDYLSGGKAVIPYEKIKSHEDCNCVPENEFLSKTEFYGSLKNEIITDDEYENVKIFWQIFRLKNFPN